MFSVTALELKVKGTRYSRFACVLSDEKQKDVTLENGRVVVTLPANAVIAMDGRV